MKKDGDILKPRPLADYIDLVERLVRLKTDAMKLGLVKTFHALDEASKVVGWEVADKTK